ncbi:malto-oligosyltrehalose synthase [Pararhodobacter sp. SW119]|uniref:malto-oligosyltrehalose synthase n=1 Tax=Pararhodobacter sp. SW119 TaxID=2780075 RepID=UPI001ADF2250|nr:malto-oligosyltrehalose synthase [Pararhodobacter sp. SW119]
MTLRATYRLQFNADFRFADALALVPYLDRLGISHLYASPITAARADSTHGYDVVDFNRLNPALGSEEDLRQLAQALHDRGMGLIVDIVPNHMGIGGSENACWQSVLEWGPASPFAHWFDIDWTATLPAPAHHPTTGKVLVPFLGGHYGVALANGELRLRRDADGLAVWAHGTHRLPICPRDYALILDKAPALRGILPDGAPPEDDPADPRWAVLKSRLAAASDADVQPALDAFTGTEGDADSWAALDTLIAGQFWRASRFTLDGDAINYRRFFTISDLAGVRVEDPEVFGATHEMILRLMREGVVDGLRIDHIDGLLDPAAYLRRLRAHVGRPFPLYVEKILGPGEDLPADWPCDGTTGYEFANQAAGLLADPQGARELTRIYPALTGQRRPPARVVQIAKQEVMAYPMAAELEALTARLLDLAARDPKSADIGRAPLRAALAGVVAALDVYRTYADAQGLSRQGRTRIASAVDRARRQAPELGRDVFDFLAGVMMLDLAGDRPQDRDAILDTAMRIQQFTGPVMAKGLEDKALYRYARLIALNEVGSEPGQFHLSVPAFHRAARARLQRSPLSMLASSTHDTKRGEDARARILALAGHVEVWQAAVSEWHRHLTDPHAPIDANEAYFFYQMLLGAWPADADPEAGPDAAALADLKDRVTAAMVKSAREAGVNTRWVFGDPRYEAALEAFIDRALSPSPQNAFLPSFRDFARRISRDATANALIQHALKLTLPGVPDIYQGAEMWEQSLVDPDNRRPVDFARRDDALKARGPDAPLWTSEMPGELAKLAITAGLLALRRERPALFAEGTYRPIAAQGPAATRFIGFVRQWRGKRLAVAAALHPARGHPYDWRDTPLTLPSGAAGTWLNLVDRSEHGKLDASRLFGAVPLAILIGT